MSFIYCNTTVCAVQGVYNRCVYKFDHYCVWIGNCIGGLNHRYFLALLFSLTAMCCHGVWGICKVFSSAVIVHHFNTDNTYQLLMVNAACSEIHQNTTVILLTFCNHCCLPGNDSRSAECSSGCWNVDKNN